MYKGSECRDVSKPWAAKESAANAFHNAFAQLNKLKYLNAQG